MFGSFSKKPGGDIFPCRFVKLQADGTVVACGAGEDMWGISQPNTRNFALSTRGDDGLAGKLDDGAINIIGPGDDEALLELGGTVTNGQRIKSGALGVGVAATADKDKAGAIALQSGVTGDRIRVKPMRFDLGV